MDTFGKRTEFVREGIVDGYYVGTTFTKYGPKTRSHYEVLTEFNYKGETGFMHDIMDFNDPTTEILDELE